LRAALARLTRGRELFRARGSGHIIQLRETRMRQETHWVRWESIGNIVLIGGGAFCFLVFSYFFYHYNITGERQFSNPIGEVLYYYLPAALATLLFGALRLERSQRINVAILCGSLGVSIYAGELFLALSAPSPLAARAIWGGEIQRRKYEVVKLAKQFGVDFDTRSGLEVLLDLRAEGIDAVPGVIPVGLLKKQEDGSRKSELSIHGSEFLPLGGISNKVVPSCNEIGRSLNYESDEHGFHNPKGIWQSNRADVVAVGDSFAQGGCAPSDKIFVALIRERYPLTLNLAMAGDGPLMKLATLKEYLPFLRPKIVLWFHFEGSDADDLIKEQQSPLLMRYLESNFSQKLIKRQAEIDRVLTDYVQREMSKQRAGAPTEAASDKIRISFMEISKLGNWRRKLGLIFGEQAVQGDKTFTEDDMTLFRTILSQAKNSVAAFGGTLYFVSLPAWERYGNPQVANMTFTKYRDRVLALAKDLGIPTIDIDVGFKAQKDPLSLFPFRRFGHYNEEGHRVVAETVLKAIP
jgi:hypothetical protein